MDKPLISQYVHRLGGRRVAFCRNSAFGGIRTRVFRITSPTHYQLSYRAPLERLFSQLKLIKSVHRNRLHTITLHKMMMVKLNCDAFMFGELVDSGTASYGLHRRIEHIQSICDWNLYY